MKKVMIAMSGGVDSSAALVVLKDKYELIGVTLKLHDGEYEQSGQKTSVSEAILPQCLHITILFLSTNFVPQSGRNEL